MVYLDLPGTTAGCAGLVPDRLPNSPMYLRSEMPFTFQFLFTVPARAGSAVSPVKATAEPSQAAGISRRPFLALSIMRPRVPEFKRNPVLNSEQKRVVFPALATYSRSR